jgi:flagella basal body P-ring formation protein FlgA
VTNPNLRGGYVTTTNDVLGKVTTRTLLPGRTIPGWRAARCLGGRARNNRGPGVQARGLTITAVGTPA